MSQPAAAHRQGREGSGAGRRRAQHLRAQPDRLGAGGAEGDHLAVGEPAFRADDDDDLAHPWDLQLGQGTAGLFVQHHG